MLEQLARKHNEILKVAYKITGDLDIAKDVVQDAYIKLYDSQKAFEEIEQ